MHVYKWKPFCIGRLFKVFTGGDLILNDVEEGAIPVASHRADNNGIGALVNTIVGQQLFDSNKTIALADRGCFHASVQAKDFYIGTRVKALVIKPKVKKEVLFFIATIINMLITISYLIFCRYRLAVERLYILLHIFPVRFAFFRLR